MIAILFHKAMVPHDKLPMNLPTHVLACILICYWSDYIIWAKSFFTSERNNMHSIGEWLSIG